MTINFNVKDSIGESFISASRWQIPDRLDLNDSQIVNKCLKKYIGTLIDQHVKYTVLGSDEEKVNNLRIEVNNLRIEESDLRIEFMEAQRDLMEKKRLFESTNIPVDPEA